MKRFGSEELDEEDAKQAPPVPSSRRTVAAPSSTPSHFDAEEMSASHRSGPADPPSSSFATRKEKPNMKTTRQSQQLAMAAATGTSEHMMMQTSKVRVGAIRVGNRRMHDSDFSLGQNTEAPSDDHHNTQPHIAIAAHVVEENDVHHDQTSPPLAVATASASEGTQSRTKWIFVGLFIIAVLIIGVLIGFLVGRGGGSDGGTNNSSIQNDETTEGTPTETSPTPIEPVDPTLPPSPLTTASPTETSPAPMETKNPTLSPIQLITGSPTAEVSPSPTQSSTNEPTASLDPQCFMAYGDLNEADRNVNFNDGNLGIEFCDRNDRSDKSPSWLGSGWYRLVGEAGTQIPETAPSDFSCGTDSPGWLSGTHPSLEDGIVDRLVCFSWEGILCNWSTDIRVVNCGNFYLYYLAEPVENCLRFCGETLPSSPNQQVDSTPAPSTTSPNTPSSMSSDPRCLEPYRELNEADRNVNFNDGNDNIEFCDRVSSPSSTSPSWVGFGWYRLVGEAGTQIPETAPSDFSCGTDSPGWLSGTHPSLEDGVVDRLVCFSWEGTPCNWRTDIQVVNCGDFYLYFLVEPDEQCLRFCGETVQSPTTPNQQVDSTPAPSTTSPNTPSSMSSDPQCMEPYGELNEADRNVNFNDGNDNIEFCDSVSSSNSTSPSWVGSGWYRLVSDAGTQMTETAPSTYSCGTDSPGWLNGTHPTPEDGIVDREVCFVWSGNACNWGADIQVVNCAGFYLYKLVELSVCSLRFCGETAR